MKKFITYLFFFMMTSIVIYFLLAKIAIASSDIFKDGAAIICESKRQLVRNGQFHYSDDRKNILIIGASNILSGFVPGIFDSLNQNKTYTLNLSLPGLPIGPHYFMLLDYLKNNPPPQIMIVNLSIINPGKQPGYFDYLALQGLKTKEELISYYLNREDKTLVLNYFLRMNLYNKFMLKYVYYSLFKSSGISKMKKMNKNYSLQMQKAQGYFFIKDQALFPDNRLPDNFRSDHEFILQPNDYDVFSDYYIRKFFDLAKEKNIKILLIQSFERENTFSQYKRLPYYFYFLKKNYENIKWAKDGYKIIFYKNRYFADPSHLNYEGARLYTTEIFKQFQEVKY